MHSSTVSAGAAVSRRSKPAQFFRSLRTMAEPIGAAVCLFLFSFIKWFGLPSPFAAALLAALPVRPSPLCLAGMGASLGFRLLFGLETDIWQYAGCLVLWLLLQKCRPQSNVEASALGALSMMPRILHALLAHKAFLLFNSCASLPVCMLFSVVLRTGLQAVNRRGSHMRSVEKGGLFVLGLLVVSGLGYFGAGPVNLGMAAAVAATTAFAAVNGPLYGVVGGGAVGLVLALGGHDAHLLLTLALSGFLCGMMPKGRLRWLAIPAVLLSNGVAWFVSQTQVPPMGWSTCAAGAAACLFVKACWQEKLKMQLIPKGDRSMENAFVIQRIEHMRAAIENLAQALPDWEEDALSDGEELAEKLCAQCQNREMCWGRSRSRTEKMLHNAVERSRRGEEVLPALALGCLRADEVSDAAQELILQQHKRRAAFKKARYERKLTLTHLAALSGTLEELGGMAVGESFNDLRAAHVITLALEGLRIPARLSYARRIDGHLQAELIPDSLASIHRPLEQLLRYLDEEEDMPLSVSRMEKGRIELEEIPLYSASVGMASMCADGSDENCGDACCAKRCEGGRLLMMLCDGMGHGETAQKQSEKTLELLLLLLEAGYTRHQAITAVNGIMLGAQAQERFSTVDLADVDLWTGDVYGEKLGACASWVVRGSHMKKVEGSSLPLGILQDAQPTAMQYRLHSGDILILMSDGVADALGDDAQTKKIIAESLFIQPQRMADALLRSALMSGGGTPGDDMTVMVLLLMDRRHG